MKQIIGQNIRAKRLELGLSQTEAAKLCGLSIRSYGKIERAQENVSLGTLEGIMRGFNLTWQDLGREE